MPQKYTNLSSLFTDIADAIREKKGTSENIIADDFPDEISSIESGSDIIDFEKKFLERTIQLSIYENSHTTIIGDGAFYSYSSLTSVNFPQVTSIGSSAFQNCYALTSVSFPQATSIGDYAFGDCRLLTSVILGGQQSQRGIIYSQAFASCYHLTDLHLQGSYLYSLSNSNAFSSTPIAGYSASAGKFGSIYVPAPQYSYYISATNWAYFSSRFVSVGQDSGGNNDDCGFTVNGNTLIITDNSKLNDGLLNTDDYLVVGIGLDDDSVEELTGSIQNDSTDFRIFNNELEQLGFYNKGLSICLIDNNNITYNCLLDESLFEYIVFANLIDDQGTPFYIPVIHKNDIFDSLIFQNNLDFYMLGYTADFSDDYYHITEFNLTDYFGTDYAVFDNWHETSIEAIEPITNDMFRYPPQE